MNTLKLRWMLKEPSRPAEEKTSEITFQNADERADKELQLAQSLVKGYVEIVWIGGQVKFEWWEPPRSDYDKPDSIDVVLEQYNPI